MKISENTTYKKGLPDHFSYFEGLFTFFKSLFLKNWDLLNENNYRNSMFYLSNINLLNENFCVARDALDTKGFGTPTEMLVSLILHPSINKYKNFEDLKNVTMKLSTDFCVS